jgi:hypothetical protein
MKRILSVQRLCSVMSLGLILWSFNSMAIGPVTKGICEKKVSVAEITVPASQDEFDPKVIAGRWNWVEGQQLEIFADGTSKTWLNGSQINSGTWVCTDKNERRYTFRLNEGGWVDHVALSSDYNTLNGQNQQGNVLTGTRIGNRKSASFDPKVIAGRWNWVEGQQLEIFTDGTSKTWLNGSQINSGTWVCTDKNERRYTFRLNEGGWVDHVALSSDYNTLSGQNQQGNVLSGTRIR